ncbi:MAG: hypothetical protein Kow0089_16930 [Desulfobulbaceae bacterium]
MLAYQSYLKGNRVVGITFKEKEVQGCKDLFNTYLGIPEERLRFRQGNLYELDFPPETFDEIICSEVLEHLQRDTVVCKTFQRLLKPEGILHVCAPNAEHPYNAAFPLDEQEKGGHVRAGYTLDGYRNLLEPLGFKIVKSAGLGGPIRQAFNWRIKEIQAKYGTITGLPLFVIFFLLLPLERRWSESNSPFSIYVKAVNKG